MIREHLFHKSPGADSDFRWRGGEVSRIEAYSDGIFAITVTLLIVANTNINQFYDVWLLVRDLPAFLISFAMIMYAWFEHYMFFRRYGLSDGLTILLNALFLFLIMTLAYPLKLLSTFLWYLIIGEPTQVLFVMPEDAGQLFSTFDQRVYMMYFYSASIIGVFGILLLMHINAYWKRNTLDLDQLEMLITNKSIAHHGASVVIAITSILILWLTYNPGISGIIYFLMPFIHFVVGFSFAKLIGKNKESNQ